MSTPTATPRTDDEETPLITNHRVSAETYKRMVDLARTLETELAEAKAEAAHYMSVAQKATDDLTRLRADNLTAHQMACAAGLERDQLRAEVSEARRAWLGDDYGHLPLIEALEKFRSDSDAESDRADVLYQRACEVEHALRAEVERLKATLLSIEEDGTSEHNAAVGLRQNLVAAIARAERFEAERDAFAKDKARLDWLEDHGWITGEPCDRAAIDAAMKP